MRLLYDPAEGGEGGGGGATLLDDSGGNAGGAPPAGGGESGGDAGTQSPFYRGLYGEDGALNHSNFDRLPEHLQPYRATFEKYKTVEALLGGMANMSKLVGKKMDYSPLGEDASDDQRAERADMLRKLNGVPESPEQYGVEYPEDFPEDMRDTERLNTYMKVLHEHNAPPGLVKALVEMDMQEALTGKDSANQALEQTLSGEQNKLKEAWGNEYEKNMDLAFRGAKTLGLDKENPVFQNAEAVQAMAKVAGLVSEDRLVSGASDASLGMSDREKALDIVNNPSNALHAAYHDAGHPQHQQAVETRSRFNQRYHELKQKGRA